MGSSILKKLGVPRDVQLFFAPYLEVDAHGNLLFAYGDEWEHFGWNFHRVPAAVHCWVAGNVFARQVFICSSAMEAVAFLSLNGHRFKSEDLLFVSAGPYPTAAQLSGFNRAALVFGSDTLGRLLDIHVAALLYGQEVQLAYRNMRFSVGWRNGVYVFEEAKLSLSAFERASGARFGIRTYKPKGFNSFLDQLKYQDGK